MNLLLLHLVPMPVDGRRVSEALSIPLDLDTWTYLDLEDWDDELREGMF